MTAADAANSIEYSVGTTAQGTPCVVVTSQPIDWEGRSTGPSTEVAYTIPEIEQLVGFCLRCGNSDLLRSVRRPLYAHLQGPEHPFAKE